MDYTKFPKQRSPLPSHIGEQQARFLDTLDTPALRRRNADGSTSRKVGGRLYVTPGPDVQEGEIYTSGRLTTGQSGVFRSFGPREGFSRIGQLPFLSEMGDIGYLTNNSDGSAAAVNSDWLSNAADFDYSVAWGKKAARMFIDVYRTTNGARVRNDFSGYTVTSLEGSGANNWSLVSGKVFLDGTRYRKLRGAATLNLEGGHYWPTFYRSVDDGPIELAPTWGLENTLMTGITNLVLGPDRFLMIAQCARSIHRPTKAVNADNRVLFAQYSADAGASWHLPSRLPAFDDEIASLQAIPMQWPNDAPAGSNDRWAEIFNTAAAYFQISSAAPVTRTRAFVLATVPYMASPEDSAVRARVKVVEINTRGGGCTVTTKQVLFDGWVKEALAFRGQAWPSGSGMFYTVQRIEHDPDMGDGYKEAPNLLPEVWHTEDGVTSVQVGTMPRPAYCLGYPIYTSKKEMACVMYAAGQYCVYLSRDAASWARGGLVTAAGIPPSVDPSNPLASMQLRNFSAVAHLQAEDEDGPVNLYPQAPWISDARAKAPE